MFKPWLKPEVETPARTFTPDLDGLIAWLSEQDGGTEYDSWSIHDCLICRFASAVRGIKHDPAKRSFSESRMLLGSAAAICEGAAYHRPLGDDGHNMTYSAALTRAINLRDAGK